ncbi:hypothetical protein PIB30_098255, partial [Stylosanthes scabra]|nr:hypothetical protein [Stylosanthes scabra]
MKETLTFVDRKKEQKEAWKARKEENRATGQKQSYSDKYRVLTPRRHYSRLGVAEPQVLFSLIHHPTPRHDARRLSVDEATRKMTLHQGLDGGFRKPYISASIPNRI